MSLEPGQVFSGDFRVERELSRGGMGQVYVATQLSTGRMRALKVMRPELVADPDMRKRFEQEAKVGADIKSDHVVEVIAAGVDEATRMPWLAMELLEGESLASMVARTDGLSHEDAGELLDQLAHALAAAHAAGVVHRDLKPDNVFVARARRKSEGWTVKVLDFGIAKVVAEARVTATAPLGTLFWMAPEQADSAGVIGPATDAWAYGLVAFDAIVGRPFWDEGASVPVLVKKLTVDPIPSASQRAKELGREERLPPGFDGWLSRCLARDPAGRFASIASASDGLQRLLRTSSASMAPTEPVGQLVATAGATAAGPASKRSPALAWLAAAVGVGAVVALMMRARSDDTPAPVATASASSSAAPVASTAASAGRLKLFPEDDDDHDTVYRVPLGDSPRRGAAQPLLTIVEFGEFQCPFARGYEDRLKEILTAYPDDVAVVWKDLPLSFHPLAEPSARLARLARAELGDDGFWRAHDLLFSACTNNQRDQVERVGRELGLPASKVRAALDASGSDGIDRDVDLAVNLGGFGTPTSFFNGRIVSGSRPFERLRVLIEQEIAKGKALVASGVPRQGVYEALQSAAVADPPHPRTVLDLPRTGPVLAGAHAVLDVHQIGDETSAFTGLRQPAVDYLLRVYGDRIRFYWHSAPAPADASSMRVAAFDDVVFGQNGNEVFWKMHRMLVANEEWPFPDPTHPKSRGFDDDVLVDFAKQAGANPLYLRERRSLPGDKTEAWAAMHKILVDSDSEGMGLLYSEGYTFGGTRRGTQRLLDELLAGKDGGR